MGTDTTQKLKGLLSEQSSGTVLLSSWLVSRGYSSDLQQRYKKSGWLKPIGRGAFVRPGDEVDYLGGVNALQTQQGASIHPGGRTALSLLGSAHYLELATKRVVVFGDKSERLPAWFQNHDWRVEVDYHATGFLPTGVGMVEITHKSFSVHVSGAARAMMECLYLAPARQDLMECYELMEGLNNLRPTQVQSLLETCQSVKVKRLFLFMAEKAGHAWFNYLNLTKVDLGSGPRSVTTPGVYDPKYRLMIPRELAAHGKSDL